MEFRNLTPFPVMEYAMDDTLGKLYHIIVLPIGSSVRVMEARYHCAGAQ